LNESKPASDPDQPVVDVRDAFAAAGFMTAAGSPGYRNRVLRSIEWFPVEDNRLCFLELQCEAMERLSIPKPSVPGLARPTERFVHY
jgi:hypothetical protein